MNETLKTIADDRTWVSLAGRAALIPDDATIEEVSDPMSETFFADDDQPVVLQIVTDRIEWWASPNKAVQLIELAKARMSDSEPGVGATSPRSKFQLR